MIADCRFRNADSYFGNAQSQIRNQISEIQFSCKINRDLLLIYSYSTEMDWCPGVGV